MLNVLLNLKDTLLIFVVGFVVSFLVLFVVTRLLGTPSDEFGLYKYLAHPPSFNGIMGILGMYTAFRVFVSLFIN